jgi:hypothetical protein
MGCDERSTDGLRGMMVDGDEGRDMQGGERRCHAEMVYPPVVPTWMTTLHVPAKRTENWHPVIVFHPQLSAFRFSSNPYINEVSTQNHQPIHHDPCKAAQV